ncbi:hypothetical protein EYF80_058807 [Liparis tanakae]|uniref:Uncharacterized protein n=1 Tax=Liparis tanakae TaxID=230148 RepID=A0A4Z2ER36_9TELE|nr:hypothetical protein EYF80_058807 [Liparis tanakae]
MGPWVGSRSRDGKLPILDDSGMNEAGGQEQPSLWWDKLSPTHELSARLWYRRGSWPQRSRPPLQEAKCQAPAAASPAPDGSLVESHPYVTGSGRDGEHSLTDYSNGRRQQPPLTCTHLISDSPQDGKGVWRLRWASECVGGSMGEMCYVGRRDLACLLWL